MIYAITNVSTGAFEGFYDSSYGDMTVTALFIVIDNTKRDDLLANPMQFWTGTVWNDLALSLDELKTIKQKELDDLYADSLTVNWTQGVPTGTGWVSRLERVLLTYTATTISTGTIHVMERAVTFTALADFTNVMEDIEVYEHDVDEWYIGKTHDIYLADETALAAITLTAGQPVVITVDLDLP